MVANFRGARILPADNQQERSVVLQVLGALLVFATLWAALQTEGVPVDRCAGDDADGCAGTSIPRTPQASLSRTLDAVARLI